MATEDILINDGDSFVSLSALAAEQVDAKLPIESEDGTVVLSDSSGTFVVSTGNPSATRLTVSDDAVNSSVAIKAPSVSGRNDNDPVFQLNSLFNFQFKNSDGGFGSKINVGYNETSSGGFANVGVGGCYWYLRDSKRFGIGATGINFNANAAANASTYDWSMEPDGTFVSNAARGIETAYITAGRNNSNNAPETAPKITLDGTSALLAGSDGSEYVVTDAASIATKKYVDDNAGSYDDTQIKAQLNSEQISRTAGDNELQRQLDNKIWVGTNAEYQNIVTKDPKILYCLTD